MRVWYVGKYFTASPYPAWLSAFSIQFMNIKTVNVDGVV